MTPQEYYEYKFPFEQLEKLLTINGDKLENCEFALEGKSNSGDKIYKRYVSAKTAAELRRVVCAFPNISTVHFGAFYSQNPANRRNASVPVRRVLSFDIDLTDKDFLSLLDVDGKVSLELCDAAYPVSAMSAYILRTLLQRAFGYTQILVVYSGRRGVHVHVFDEEAMRLDNEARSAIVSYVNGSMDESGLRMSPGVALVMSMHGLREEVYRSFEKKIVQKMHALDNCGARIDFVNRLNLSRYAEYETLAPLITSLEEDVTEPESGTDAWLFIKKKVLDADTEWISARLDLVVLSYVWPRLDENVTRSLGHLTKVPFACHATSGRVAVAMGAQRISLHKFVPEKDSPNLSCWDQVAMDTAIGNFNVEEKISTCADVDMEDVVEAHTRIIQPVPSVKPFVRKRSPLVPTK